MNNKEEKKVVNVIERVLDGFINSLKTEDHLIFSTESDLKCFLYHRLRQELQGQLDKNLWILTEFKIKNITDLTNRLLGLNNHQHPRIDLALVTEIKIDEESGDRLVTDVLYGVELKSSYSKSNFKKGIDSFIKDFERIQSIHNLKKLKYGKCIWYDNFDLPKNIDDLRQKVHEVKKADIDCIYIETGKNPEFLK